MNWKVTALIVTGLTIFTAWHIAYGESTRDFQLEAKVNSSGLDVTRFEISGESDKQICPSGQCNIELEGSRYFIAPTSDRQSIGYSLEFKVHDNDNQTNIGPIKKLFMEHFNTSTSILGCKIDDIIEDNGQEIYYCHGINIMTNDFDSTRWYYDINGIYDAKNNTLKIHGGFTGNK